MPTANVSLRAFAKLIGVNDKAVRKAIASGRLKKSIGKNAKGHPVVKDVALAMREWAANAAKPSKGEVTLNEVQRQVGMERALKLKFEREREAKLWMSIEEQERAVFNKDRVIRESMLNIPTRIAGELAAETDPAKVFSRLDTEIRLALTSAADRLDAMAQS